MRMALKRSGAPLAMRVGWVMTLLVASLSAGCTTGEPTNPNLAAPKVVVALDPDNVPTVYVHSAFGERMYEWIEVRVDNETIGNRSNVFSWESSVASHSFFLEVFAESGTQLYEVRALIEIQPTDQQAEISFLQGSSRWSEPRSFGLPFERIMERRNGT